MIGLLRKLRRDQRGVSAIEFAFIAPVMILFYFGMVETCQVMMAERRVVRTASSIADLVAQAPGSITATGAGGVSDIFLIGETLMEPFDTGTALKICLAHITANSDNTARTVDWVESKNSPADCPTTSDNPTVPTGVLAANQSVVMAKVTYSYSGTANVVIKVNPSFTRTFYFRPRRSSKIDCSTC